MKTLIVYWTQEGNKFFIVEGDYTRLQGCIVNVNDEDYSEEVKDEVCEAKWGAAIDLPLANSVPTWIVECGFFL